MLDDNEKFDGERFIRNYNVRKKIPLTCRRKSASMNVHKSARQTHLIQQFSKVTPHVLYRSGATTLADNGINILALK